jgi:hypothetical protein
MSDFPTGWIENKPAVQQYLAAREAAGNSAILANARPDLKGNWKRTVESGVFSVLLYQAEESLLGHYLPADYQKRGTCVGRGTYRAVQTGYWDAVCERRITGKAEHIAYEPIYAGGRVNIGRGGCGSGDGCVGAWAAQWCHDFGVIPRAAYNGIDLTSDREDLAVAWGAPGRGVPSDLLKAGAAHKCDAYHVADAADLADVVSARYACAICSTHQQTDRRDENGECGYKGSTAHCESIVGVYMRPSWNGNPATIYENTGFVDQQSWGNIPSGPDTLKIYKGTAKLREGAYGTTMQAVRSRIVTGETWAFRLRDGFRASSLTEAVK